jgi:hypothetical protein
MDRPKGPAILPARPIGPGKAPTKCPGPTGQQFFSWPTWFEERLARWAGRCHFRPATRAYDPGWGNGWPFGPDDPRPKPTPTSPTRSRPKIVHRHRPTRTPSDPSTTALKGHKKVAGGWSEALPPDSRPPNTRRTPVGVPEDRETTFIRDHRLVFLPNPPAHHVRRLDSDSTATSDHRSLEPLSGFWSDLGIAFRGYRVAEPPATLLNPFGDDLPGPDGLRRGDGERPKGPRLR